MISPNSETNLILSVEERAFILKLLSLFKIDGEPADTQVTEGQLLIFAALVLKKRNRIQIITSTQYGKSLIVALACLILSCIDGELISIPAPTSEKAKIIMRYYLQHMGDHPLFYSQLEKDDKVDRLIMETSRDRLILKNRGGVFILSVHAGNSQKGFEAAMGEGSRIVIQDESALIPDTIESTVFRMIAGKKDAVYVKIGNPFYRNHFFKSWQDDRYLKIFIDFKQGLKEGRYDYDFIEEARSKPNFDVLYACKFPEDSGMDADAYYRLLTESELQRVLVPSFEHAGFLILGVDPAAGGDNSSIVLKSHSAQEVLFDQKLNDVMDLASITFDFARNLNVAAIAIDKGGVGQGVFDRVKAISANHGIEVYGISFAESPSDSDAFMNLKAELYWKEREFILKGGRLIRHLGWQEAHTIKYKTIDGKIKIQPKEELFRKGIASPNVFDAAALTQYVKENAIKSSRVMRARHGQFYDHMKTVWKA